MPLDRRRLSPDHRALLAALCSVDGAPWLTFGGMVGVDEDHEARAAAVAASRARYRSPRPNPDRVVLRIDVDRISGGA